MVNWRHIQTCQLWFNLFPPSDFVTQRLWCNIWIWFESSLRSSFFPQDQHTENKTLEAQVDEFPWGKTILPSFLCNQHLAQRREEQRPFTVRSISCLYLINLIFRPSADLNEMQNWNCFRTLDRKDEVVQVESLFNCPFLKCFWDTAVTFSRKRKHFIWLVHSLMEMNSKEKILTLLFPAVLRHTFSIDANSFQTLRAN